MSTEYDQEQDRLKKQADGESDGLVIPKEPEVNPEVYKDVEPLLFRGFLTISAEINGVHFVFKSLNHHEFSLVRMMGDVRDGIPPPRRFWDLFLAYGVFMIDGQNVLPDRERMIPKIAGTFAEFTRNPKNLLIRHMSELNRRSASAVVLTEAYATENYSRFRWAQLQATDITAPSVTGISGTERLGMNSAQLVWRALNYYEDLHTQIERDWENAKFVGSCMAGKGIQKIYHQDDRRRKTERETAAERKDRLLRHVILGESLDEKKNSGTKIVAKTVEDLAEQIRKDLKGEKDWHDNIVSQIEERARNERKKRRADLDAVMAENDSKFEGRQLQGATDFAGLTPEEMKERVTRNKQYEAQAASSRIFHPELLDEKYAQGLQKWGITGETSTSDPSTAIPSPEARNGKPFRSKV